MRYVRSSTVLYGDHFYFNTADAGTINYNLQKEYENLSMASFCNFLVCKTAININIYPEI